MKQSHSFFVKAHLEHHRPDLLSSKPDPDDEDYEEANKMIYGKRNVRERERAKD